MNQRKHSFMSMGIPSLFLIFTILCLVILSLLSLGTSRSDLRLSERALEQTTAYYQACGTATELYHQAEKAAQTAYGQAKSQKEYYDGLKEITSSIPEFCQDEDTGEFYLDVPLSDSQSLHITFNAPHPHTDGKPYLEITAWQTIPAGTWEADTRQPVYQGGNQEISLKQ